MRVINTFSGRPEYYDRNPLEVGVEYDADSVAPAGTVQRWIYTVPAGRKAFIESVAIVSLRNVVATTASWVEAYVTANGAATPRVLTTMHFVNTVGTNDNRSLGNCGSLQAGEAIRSNTQDSSTGGSNNFRIGAKVLEYDA